MTPEELGLTDDLASRIATWSLAGTTALDGGGCTSPTEAEAFVEDGQALEAALQSQLGSGWVVEDYGEQWGVRGTSR